MADKHSFILYDYIAGQVDALSNEEAGQLFKGILNYVANGELPDLPRIAMVVFLGIKNDIDRANEQWEKKRQTLSEAGKRGAEARKKTRAFQQADPDANLQEKKDRALAMLGLKSSNY